MSITLLDRAHEDVILGVDFLTKYLAQINLFNNTIVLSNIEAIIKNYTYIKLGLISVLQKSHMHKVNSIKSNNLLYTLNSDRHATNKQLIETGSSLKPHTYIIEHKPAKRMAERYQFNDVTADEISNSQDKDDFYNAMKLYPINHVFPTDKKMCSKMRQLNNDFMVVDGLLYHVVFNKNKEIWQELCIPKEYINMIMRNFMIYF